MVASQSEEAIEARERVALVGEGQEHGEERGVSEMYKVE
jgi:hypothetical protein